MKKIRLQVAMFNE